MFMDRHARNTLPIRLVMAVAALVVVAVGAWAQEPPSIAGDLAGTFWDENPVGFGYFLSFKTGRDFIFGYSGEGQETPTAGTWSLEGNVLVLSAAKPNGEYMSFFPGGIMRCMVFPEPVSVFGELVMAADNGKRFIRITPGPDPSSPRLADGVRAFAIPRARGTLAANARVRLGPGTAYLHRIIDFGSEGGKKEALQSGSEVTMLARSEAMDTIAGVSDYWYWCCFPTAVYEYETGWIWGGLIRKP